MKRLWLVAFLALFLGAFCAYAQEAPPPKPGPEPKPVEPKDEPKPDDGKIVVYINILDYVDGKPYKWRMTGFLIQKTFELANPETKEKWKADQRKRHDWSKWSKEKREKKIEKDYKDLRKKKGVDKLDLSHVKVVRWRKKPKEKKKEKDEGKNEEKGENGEEPQKKPAEPVEKPHDPDESGEKPHNPDEGGEKPDKPEKPAPKKWVDPAETADYLIIGEGKFKKGKKAVYFKNTVAWNSLGELHVRVIRRIDRKVIKEFDTKPLKRSHTLGQERAHQQCMQDIGQKLASEIVNLPVFKKPK